MHLELGGKAPVIVFDDVDVAKAAEAIAIAGYFNAGQDCTAATRVLASPKVLRRHGRRPGRAGPRDHRSAGLDQPDVAFGPLNNATQLERVQRHGGQGPEPRHASWPGERLPAVPASSFPRR